MESEGITEDWIIDSKGGIYMTELMRDQEKPLYIQMADQLKKDIEQGILKENEKIPTEFELSEKYNVSRITVRKALEILSDEELLTRKQGIGTFVTGKKLIRNMSSFMSFTQSCLENGLKPGTKFLSADIVKALPSDTKVLNLEDDDKVIRIRRLRYSNDEPVMIEENHFPRKYAFLLAEDLNRPLFELLGDHGIFLSEGSRKISICHATKEEARELGVKENEALLYMRDVGYEPSGNAVYSGKCIVNSDRYECNFRAFASERDKR